MSLESQNILITGGCGFIGSNIARELSKDNDVKIIDDLSSGRLENIEIFKEKVNFVKLDQRDDDLIKEFEGVDIVFHLGANVFINRSVTDPIFDANINIIGTLNVLEACRKRDVKRLVFSSSSSVYGDPVSIPITEEHVKNPKSPYAVGKRAGEYYCKLYHELYGLETVSLRYFNVFGPNQRADDPYSGVIAIFTTNALEGRPLTIYGDGEQTRDFVNVKDVVKANIAAAISSRAVGEKINIGTGKTLTINHLVNTVKELVGEVEIGYEEPRVGDILDSIADISKAREMLGFDPGVSFEEGMGEIIEVKRGQMG